jgi:hypothetical protein
MKVEASLVRARSGTGPAVDFTGDWINELGSTMTLSQSGDRLEGTYESKVSTGGGTTSGDLLGYADGSLIATVVHWRDYQAITAWVGQLDADEVTINTLWQMTKTVDAGDQWASINAGADAFSRTT